MRELDTAGIALALPERIVHLPAPARQDADEQAG
jgi:hypothetical protein